MTRVNFVGAIKIENKPKSGDDCRQLLCSSNRPDSQSFHRALELCKCAKRTDKNVENGRKQLRFERHHLPNGQRETMTATRE